MIGAELFQFMGGEIGDQQASAGLEDAESLGERPAGIIQIVKYLMYRNEIAQ